MYRLPLRWVTEVGGGGWGAAERAEAGPGHGSVSGTAWSTNRQRSVERICNGILGFPRPLAGYFLDRPAADSPFYCAPCQLVLGCSACDADKGCASCPAGYGLARMGAHWNAGVASCVKTGIKAPAAAAAAANATR